MEIQTKEKNYNILVPKLWVTHVNVQQNDQLVLQKYIIYY